MSSELKKIETENFYCRALMRVSFALQVRETSVVGGMGFLLRQTDAGGVIFANMIVIQSVKKRQTEELTSMYRKEPKTSTSIIFTTKIKKFVLMHKQNREESTSNESLKKWRNCVANLVKLEPCILILAFKDISKYRVRTIN
jgi:hypothetical protein